MANARTEKLIKGPIQEIVDDQQYKDIFLYPEDGPVREYPLFGRFRADFALNLPDESWLFIEDDDAKRAPINLTKYWMWMKDNAIGSNVYFVHIVGPGYPGYKKLCGFIQEKIARELPGFHYTLILTQDWEASTWRRELRQALDSVHAAVLTASHHSVRGKLAPEDATPSLRKEAFVGMWKDREEMQDSTEWVRKVRRRQWRKL